ncbi:hypothetical protein P154DRAFT_562663 [Amniculicola lignicola CBS 123094]|uniref:Prion-inhibition and propagation HeLo domain-containing protein n=1 Tax=Amniculicola lignicola CBS 123094 TaxID=1392246 RepID=A0A6A5WHF7_9PLEO|nr:hypothetical protein P154DRAFT_562663 [Amniculicola lignicola CBS 123094]
MANKVKWVICKPEGFSSLIDKISTLIDGLIDTFPSELAQNKQQKLCEQGMIQLDLQHPEQVAILRKANEGMDRLVQDALDTHKVATGNTITSPFGDGNTGL